MSGLWVAVIAEFAGSTFSHRATRPAATDDKALHMFNVALDESAICVRNGLAGWLPPQQSIVTCETPVGTVYPSLSEHEKLREIRKILDASSIGGQEIIDIYEVLNR